MTVMDRGFADEAVVVVKLEAEEDAVTYLRVKLSVSGRSWRRRAEHANGRVSGVMVAMRSENIPTFIETRKDVILDGSNKEIVKIVIQ